MADVRPRALDSFLREVYGYWATGGLFAVASLAWGRVLMLLCVGLTPLTFASIDFHELATCRSRDACPTTAAAYWRNPTATATQVVAFAFFCATLPGAAALAWAAAATVRRGRALQTLVGDFAGVPDEELGLRGWDGVLCALGDAAVVSMAAPVSESSGGLNSHLQDRRQHSVPDGVDTESLERVRQAAAAAMARLPADVQPVIQLLGRSVSPLVVPPETSPQRRAVLHGSDALSRHLPRTASHGSPSVAVTVAAPAGSGLLSSVGLPFASLSGSVAAAAESPRPVTTSQSLPLAESTWLRLPIAGKGPYRDAASFAPLPSTSAAHPSRRPQLLRPRDVAVRILRLEGYLAALAAAGELGHATLFSVPSPLAGAQRLRRIVAACCTSCTSRLCRAPWGRGGMPEAERLLLPHAPSLSPPAPSISTPFHQPIAIPLPFTLSLQWALQTLVLAPMLSSRGTLRPSALSAAGIRAAQTRCRWVGAAGLLALPITLPLAVLWVCLRQAEDALAARDYLGPRAWAPLAALLFAEYAELPHVVSARLAAAREPAQRFLDAFPAPALAAAGRGVAFVAAALLAVLGAIGAADEDALLFVTIGGRSLWFYAAALGAVLAVARAATQPAAPSPAGAAATPLDRLAALAAALRFTPHAWGEGSAAWLIAARGEVSRLFLPRVLLLAAEALGALTTPLALLAVVPHRVPAIAEFVRQNTVHLPGVGAVCAPPAAPALPPPPGISGNEPYSNSSPRSSAPQMPLLPSFLRHGPVSDAEFGAAGEREPDTSGWRDRLARSNASLAEQHPGEIGTTAWGGSHPAGGASQSHRVMRPGAGRPPQGQRAAGLSGVGPGSRVGGPLVHALLSQIPVLPEDDEEAGDGEEGTSDAGSEERDGGSAPCIARLAPLAGAAPPSLVPCDSAAPALVSPGDGGIVDDLDAVGAAMEAALGGAGGSWAPLLQASAGYVPSRPPAVPPGYEDLDDEGRAAGQAAAQDFALLMHAGGAAAQL